MKRFLTALFLITGLVGLSACEISRDAPPVPAMFGSVFPAGPDYVGSLNTLP